MTKKNRRRRKHRRTHDDKDPIPIGDSDIIGRHRDSFRSTSTKMGRSIRAGEAYPQLSHVVDETAKRIGVDIKPQGDAIYAFVWDKDLRKTLGDYGIFSRNIGSGVRSDRKFWKTNDISAISMYDLLFAYQLGIVDSNHNDRENTYQALLANAVANNPDFLDKFSVYLDLRRKGLIVMDGLNYGVDFTIYADSPEDFRNLPASKRDHSDLVDVAKSTDMRLTEAIKGEQLAKSVGKDYFIASADGKRDEEGYLHAPSGQITYKVLNSQKLGIDTTADINAQIAKRIGDEHVIPWELRRKY